ncbi:uncharacterized protein [Euwallacea fornicatus]|uniref:uncharacterized protein isoform X2 n=1 Tax=Euwallacea fornicatus TaxID=995702 RepID=UPI00338F7FB1
MTVLHLVGFVCAPLRQHEQQAPNVSNIIHVFHRACQKCPTRSPVGELERKTIDNDLARRVDSVDPEQGPSSAHCSRQTRWVNYRASSESIDARIESRGTSSNRVDEDECRRARKSRSSRRHRRRQRRSRSLTNHKGNYRRSRSSSLSVEEMELSRQRCNRSNSSNESSRRLSVNDEEQMLQEHYEYQYGCYYEGAYQYDCPWEEFEGDRGYHSC